MCNNTVSKKEYIMDHAVWLACVMVWYNNLCWHPIDYMTYEASRWIMWCLIVGCVVVGIVFTIQKRRNIINMAVNVVFPFEIYTAIAYRSQLGPVITSALNLSITFSLIFLFEDHVKQNPRNTSLVCDSQSACPEYTRLSYYQFLLSDACTLFGGNPFHTRLFYQFC